MDLLYQTTAGTMVALGTSVPTVFNTKDFYSGFMDPQCAIPANDPISSPNSNAFIDFDGDCR